ncbi:MAG: spore germination protein [Firmicutes bacterium]|nr:spore germination protein [Bacillota bacterium]
MNAKSRISGLQFFTVTACFLIGTFLRITSITSVLANDAWVSVFTGAVAYLPFLAVFLGLVKRYPGKSLFEINEAVFGAVAGRILSCVYTYFFTMILTTTLLDMANFIVGFIMPGTPITLVLAAFMVSCVYATRKGLEPLARISALLASGACLVLVVNSLLTVANADTRYLFPMFTLPFLRYVQGTHTTISLYFGESIVFLTLLPMLDTKTDIKKPMIASLLFAVVIAFLAVTREILTLGPLLPYVARPSYETMRIIDIETILTRIESIYAFIMISLTFFKACTLLFASASGIAQITRIESPKPILFPFGAFVVVFALQTYPIVGDFLYWSSNVSPFIFTIIEFILPLLTLLAAWTKGFIGSSQRLHVKKGAVRK